jgi:L-ascorbate metabolism protein UlaG (beta-lactamase superfamily)
MKLVSYTHQGKHSYGVLHADGGIVDLASRIGQLYPTLLQLVQKNGYAAAQQALAGVTQADLQESEIRYLPLFLESVTIHCVGLNYAAHAAEAGHKLPEFPRTFIKIPAALVAVAGTVGWQLNHPPGLSDVQSLFWQKAAPAGTPVKVSFLGVSTVLLDDGETALLTDGFFSRPDKMAVFLRKVEPDTQAIADGLQRAHIALAGATEGSKLTAVIPLHSHYDHVMDAPEVAKRTGAVLLGSSSTLMVGKGWGLADTQMQLAEMRKPYRFGRFTVTLYPALHAPTGFTGGVIDRPLIPPVRATDYKEGQSYAMQVEHSGRTLLITSDPATIEIKDADSVIYFKTTYKRRSR